jgi:DNA polymerase delta subunit 1
MTVDMAGLKKNNSEKDQAWARPGLGDFNADTDSICFQQIEVEEGTLHGGKATVKLFGLTEASQTRPSI